MATFINRFMSMSKKNDRRGAKLLIFSSVEIVVLMYLILLASVNVICCT